MDRKNISRYFYELENIVDEFVIVLLSIGAIAVTGWILFVSSLDYNLLEFGDIIFPWVAMVALMIIGRELWLMNRKISHYLETQAQGE